jgi:hypothetical protein
VCGKFVCARGIVQGRLKTERRALPETVYKMASGKIETQDQNSLPDTDAIRGR